MGRSDQQEHSAFAVVHLLPAKAIMFSIRMTSRFLRPVCALLFATACTQATLQPSSSLRALNEPASTLAEAGRVRGDELVQAGGPSLYEALGRAGPEFLRGMGAPNAHGEISLPSVRINGVRFGAPETLKLVQIEEVANVRYWRPTAALMVYGATCDCVGGVIEVTTRRGK